MEEYLGEVLMDVKDTPFKEYKKKDWALYYIERYGGIDGAHHKDWVLDQVCRILHGSKVTIKLAKWDGGTVEWRVDIEDKDVSQKYHDWVKEFEEDDEGEIYLNYDIGIAP